VPDDETHLRLLRTTAEYVSTRQTVGPAAVQRVVRVGFAKAARLLEELEAAGKVSAPDPTGRRRVLAPDRKAEAVAAVQRAIEAAMSDPEFRIGLSAAGLARAAVDAAAPILADAIGRKILDHMETHGPDASGSWAARNAWRRHFNIAAQVANFASSTDADIARAAAEAFTRGDAVVCTGPETGDDDGY
jgi:hypothetical protein